MRDRHAVCVFAASAEEVSPRDRELARTLGAAIAGRGWRLVYGGGRAGLMGEVAVAALEAGGEVTGIIPRRMNGRERAFDDVTELVLVDSLAERKVEMDRRADAFAALPGGIGTLDEITDVLATRHLGHHERPLVLVDPHAFWRPLVALFEHMVDAGVMPQRTLGLVSHARSVEAALAALSTGRADGAPAVAPPA
jgi:uncharacterized protein (TIGR00730 family)